jgi:hypothetical protein
VQAKRTNIDPHDGRPAASAAPLGRRGALIGLGVLLAVRALLALWHYRHFNGFPFFLSSAEYLRTILSGEWARSPRWSMEEMWLPGAFWVYGAALRLRPDPLIVIPLLNTLLTLGTLLFLFFSTELLTGSAVLGLGAAAYAAFQAESLILGTGGSADPLLHLTVAAGLYCWIRSQKGGGLRWMLVACAFIAAGSLVRYEAWLVALGLACFWIHDWPRQKGWSRRLAPLIVLALPVLGWLCYQTAHGETFRFLKDALAGHDEDFGRMAALERLIEGLLDRGARPFLRLGRLLPAAAALAAFLRRDGDRAWRRYLLLGIGGAGAFLCVGLLVEIHEDLHPWFFACLTAPFVPWFVRRALSPLAQGRRRVVLALFGCLFLWSEQSNWRRLTRASAPKAAALRMAHAIKTCIADERDSKVLIEAFPERPRPFAEHAMQQGLALDLGVDRVLFDRRCDIAIPDECSLQPRTPSVLKRSARELSSWLTERRVVLVVASAGDMPAAAAYEKVRFGYYDALVAPGRPALKSCLAARGF